MNKVSHPLSHHLQTPPNRIGVLLTNLGTPEATDYWSVRRYLKEFLSDRRVIEEHPIKWWFILNFVILTVRPFRKGRDYEKIWNTERNESLLKTITRAQADKLGKILANDARILVDWAMRYGEPSIGSRLEVLRAAGCDRILLLPLYPQYAAATTATVCDKAFEQLTKMRWQPALRVAPAYFSQPVYVDAIAGSLEEHLSHLPFKPETIIASFHGMPKEYLEKGDPYYYQCATTVGLLRQRLSLNESQLMMTFQSRFGRAEWLKPYTDQTVKSLAERGIKRLAVITPGFSADCLETSEEIAMENAAIFKEAGGEKFTHVPCLNDSELGMGVIRDVTARELMGWL